ncbi:MAG: LysM peptidoglycan-binding domain-containing protein [Gemmatimonadales bacterium]
MVRSAAAVLALLILPGLALGQQPVGTHTVVDDDTLWDLAIRYYQNPFEWRVIYEANRDSIADPNLIFPREVFVIPGLPGQAATGQTGGQTAQVDQLATDTIMATGPEPQPGPVGGDAPVDLVQFGFRQARPAEQVRTVFYRDSTAQTTGMSGGETDPNFLAVSRDAVLSAPWLIPLGSEPQGTGSLEGFATEGARATTIRTFDQVRVDMPVPARVGEDLQIFRRSRTIEYVGEVIVPTGVLTVSAINDDGVVGVITKEYQRIQPGDLVRPVPTYAVVPGRVAQPVSGGSEAMIMGFAGRQELNDLGHIAFLDLGSDDGIRIGDEFVLYSSAMGTADGRLQVVGSSANTSAARILSLVDDVFRQGVVVRLARSMR